VQLDEQTYEDDESEVEVFALASDVSSSSSDDEEETNRMDRLSKLLQPKAQYSDDSQQEQDSCTYTFLLLTTS